ncbi:major facilitator superfamily domain-containing protein [Circinella umbellata]|nr:major facilitator superfamily domain-containing protein [Circinella umbellata]
MPGLSSTIYFPGLPTITNELNASDTETILTAALFVLFMGIGPVFWGSLSDYYQTRRFLLIIAMVIFTAASLGCALINNIWGLIVFRCLQSVGSSAPMAVGGGCLADLYSVVNRGGPTSTLFLSMFIGPLIGPIIGGFLTISNLTWRSTFIFCVAFGAFVLIITFLFMPETYRDNKKFDIATTLPTTTSPSPSPVASATTVLEPHKKSELFDKNDSSNFKNNKNCNQQHQLQQLQQQQEKIKKKTFNPIRPLLMLRYPHVLLPSLVGGIVFGSFFALEAVLPILYEEIYGFAPWELGLCYLGAGVGSVAGAVFQGCVSDRLLLRAREKRDGKHKIEDRIAINLWPCCFIFIPVGLLVFGWSTEYKLSYWIGIITFGIQTFGMNQVLPETNAYLLDATPGEGASVLAAATLVRMTFACVLTLCASPLLQLLGPGFLFVIFAGLSWIAAGLMLINKIYGRKMRRRVGFEQDEEMN